jgi:hypothetical protein
MKDLRNRPHEQRLRQTGRSGNQAMSAREQADEQLLDHVRLTNNDFGKLLINPSPSTAKLTDRFLLRQKFVEMFGHSYSLVAQAARL